MPCAHLHTHTHTRIQRQTHIRIWEESARVHGSSQHTLPCMHTSSCLPTCRQGAERQNHKPQLHPHGASHEHLPPRMNTTPCSHKPQLHPKGASHEHTPADPSKGQKNTPQLHSNVETANEQRIKKPQLHPTGVSLEHRTGEKRNKPQLHPTGASLEYEHGKRQRNNKTQLHPTGASHDQHARVNKDNAAARVNIDKGTPRVSSLRTNNVSHLQRTNH